MVRNIRDIEPIDDSDFARLVASFRFATWLKDDYFTRQGEVCAQFAFVASGCLRAFSVDAGGDEYTMYFAFAEWWIGDKTSFYSQTPARFSTQVLEPAALLVCDKPAWELALAEIPAFERFYRTKVRRSYEATQQRLIDAHVQSAEEKYLQLVERSPEVVARIPQKYIASYLGIKAPSLSRIRKQLASRRRNSPR